jgi:hypothetical protein
MLRNGVIEEDRSAVKIRCDSEQALSLLSWANQQVAGRSNFTITVDA